MALAIGRFSIPFGMGVIPKETVGIGYF